MWLYASLSECTKGCACVSQGSSIAWLWRSYSAFYWPRAGTKHWCGDVITVILSSPALSPLSIMGEEWGEKHKGERREREVERGGWRGVSGWLISFRRMLWTPRGPYGGRRCHASPWEVDEQLVLVNTSLSTRSLTGWLSGWLTEWLIGWLVDWLAGRDWLAIFTLHALMLNSNLVIRSDFWEGCSHCHFKCGQYQIPVWTGLGPEWAK